MSRSNPGLQADAAVKAQLALADLERGKEYPDLVIIAGAVFARANRFPRPLGDAGRAGLDPSVAGLRFSGVMTK